MTQVPAKYLRTILLNDFYCSNWCTCSHCLLQTRSIITSMAYVDLCTVWRSRHRYCMEATSHLMIMSHYANTGTPNPRNTDQLSGFDEIPAENSIEKGPLSLRFCFISFRYSFFFLTTETDRLFQETGKPTEPRCDFGSRPCTYDCMHFFRHFTSRNLETKLLDFSMWIFIAALNRFQALVQAFTTCDQSTWK